ncbi:isoflavone 7-O-methyltransferase-like [Senna tora]|uniref:isoflavone 7-O-methyltransferase n=1 Tax=Senna tora TaxID=362788 RepID=A0A834XB00_9FABA|nr:isoflavone 7-O-methyltransferase-like [Senna tora]
MGSLDEINPASEMFQAQANLYKTIYGYLNGMVLKCAVELSIPDIIHNHAQPITIPKLASILQIHPTKTAYVDRMVHLLLHNGFLAKTKVGNEEAFTLTASSKLLLKGNEPCLAPMVTGFIATSMIEPFDMLDKWFKGEEKTVTETVFGVGWWDVLERDSGYMKAFNEAMASDSRMVNMALRKCEWAFEGLDSVVDVGGGTGTTARVIAEAYPDLECVVFDLPQVVQGLCGHKNLSFVGGSMFESIPSAHAVLLKWVCHNWDDESCIKILEKSREAISGKKGGKVMIIDAVINEEKDGHAMTEVKLLYDVLMLAVNGKERNEKQWETLLLAAGFKRHKITPFFGFRSIIEAFPY